MAGVIATPLVHRFDINAANPEDPEADGDRFVILASDGVWEFIDSEAACGIVAAHGRSNRGARWTAGACEALVLEAAQRWKRETSTYRDDITAIVARLPAMETGGEGGGAWSNCLSGKRTHKCSTWLCATGEDSRRCRHTGGRGRGRLGN